MRFVLVDNFYGLTEGGPAARTASGPPLGLLSLVAVARARGADLHDVRVFDPSVEVFLGRLRVGEAGVEEAVADALLALAPDAVGLTCVGGSALFALTLAKRLKERAPGLVVALGGPHPTPRHREILARHPWVDLVVRGEAERTFFDLLEALSGRCDLADVPGVSFRRDGEVVVNPPAPLVEDLDTLPLTPWEAWPVGEVGLRRLGLEAGRGCPFHCAFCPSSAYFSRRPRTRSPARLVAEMADAERRLGITQFGFHHDLFTFHRPFVVDLCERLKGRGWRWSCTTRLDHVDPALLALMAEAGCEAIFFGVESPDPEVQRRLGKRVDVEALWPVLDQLVEMGLHTSISLITGLPGEGRAEQAASLALMERVIRRYPPDRVHVLLNLAALESGAPLLEGRAEALRFDGRIYGAPMPPPTVDQLAWMREDPAFFAAYHYLPVELPRERLRFVTRLVHRLHGLDNGLIVRLLDATGLSLPDFVDWLHAERGEPPNDPADDCAPEFLARAIAGRLGSGSAIAAVCGGILKGVELAEKHDLPVESPSAAAWRLHPRAAVIRGAPPLGAAMPGGQPAPDLDALPRVDQVIRVVAGALQSIPLVGFPEALILGLQGGEPIVEHPRDWAVAWGLSPGRARAWADQFLRAGLLVRCEGPSNAASPRR